MTGTQKSKKTEQKEKKKIIEDKTFGLKNKNKSKKVQQQIKSIHNTVMQVHDKKVKKELEEKEQKRLEKLAQKKREQELKDLFRTADDKKEDEVVQASSSEEQPTDGEEITYDSIEQEIKDEAELTIEEIVEKERAKIINGTPVTLESFTKWKQFKVEQQRKEKEREHKLQMALYEKSGHGLSGRELFKLNQSLFVDDEEADDTVYQIPEDAIDEDLFLEGDEEDAEDEIPEEIDEEYDPSTWKEKQTPKELLLAYTQIKKYPDAKFEKLPKQSPQEQGERISVIIEKPVKKEFILSKVFPSRKLAEHNASLVAYRWLQKYDEKQKKASESKQE
ncbi:hypothetical protein C9374_007613 [Naegleria lovaniensis]|uniref:ZC3H15/TMA46 family C-terminal domain-containing protein n=1 Tax=Naegleria lovaniensis TaxID=51637 RepID=A0AA88GL51_NAELO|nr:uncharacterized protein C9374_007613 [Naegleria lovaniensis]KAG2378975.1 hypothetical protein C9374_007613 [Naegleria lovaniensis]